MIHRERIKALNQKRAQDGRYVLYWMQASQRAEYNHALEYAISTANEQGKPLVVYFGITGNFPEANERHYVFMLQGLQEVEQSLRARGIMMVIRAESPEIGAVEMSKDASMTIVDQGYLRIQQHWRSHAAEHAACPVVQVESEVIVPVEAASAKEEYAAATLRPKITSKLRHYLVPLRERRPRLDSLDLEFDSLDVGDVDQALSGIDIDRSVKPVSQFRGGTRQARTHLEAFVKGKLDRYPELRNDPTADYLSNMSPYLHFGQVSPLYIALRVSESGSRGKDDYLEELIVRRELSMNFAHYSRDYDSFDGLPQWAQKTLQEHSKDPREYLHSPAELEAARTHDPYWNAAQEEMVKTGKMHGYMRMYWGKKIIEWSKSPEEAFQTALYLNNKYELDGRDPNGFTGVAWCFGKHDRPWEERRVVGTLRYMTAGGLRRKFDADAYVKRVRALG